MARRACRLTGGTAAARTGGGNTTRPRDGIITGYLLKLIRQSAGLSQEGLAEQIGVDTNTVQGWETGRRSLTGTRVATLVELRHRLRQLGADPQLLGALEDAAEADYVLAYTLGTEPGAGSPDVHPLACWVPKRSFAYLLAWPFMGQPPIALQQPTASTRRGAVAPAPVLTQEERSRYFEHLRLVAEQSLSDRRLGEARGTLLRRNVYYSLSWNPSSEATAWLSELEQHEVRRLGRYESWSPSWTAARSLVVARARRGDREPLRHFIGSALSSDAFQTGLP
jgi:transcriptional regulator with XRE-family HTH domain